jgi:hypothetical protein
MKYMHCSRNSGERLAEFSVWNNLYLVSERCMPDGAGASQNIYDESQ